jgi:hypothetical protein
MNDERMIHTINRLMVGNEDEARALLAGLDDVDLGHIRSCLRSTEDRVFREMTDRA